MVDGNTARFKMTPAEIKTENAEKVHLEVIKRTNASHLKKWIITIELPESGLVLEFPMSEEEIRAARKAAREDVAREEAIRIVRKKKAVNVETTVVEMADVNNVTFTKDKQKNANDFGSWLTNLFKNDDS